VCNGVLTSTDAAFVQWLDHNLRTLSTTGRARNKRRCGDDARTAVEFELHSSHRAAPIFRLVVRACRADDGNDLASFAAHYALTAAERAILDCVIAGDAPKRIAQKLNRSVHTIRSHLKNLYGKTETHTQSELQKTVREFIAPMHR
jgi:DNA-binding CsgD family transcriptional regulator